MQPKVATHIPCLTRPSIWKKIRTWLRPGSIRFITTRSTAYEDRDPHPLFDTSFYREQKPQVRGLGINPLIHYLKEGPTEEFDPSIHAHDPSAVGICIVTPDVVGPVKNGGIGTACYHFARVLAEGGRKVSVLFTGEVVRMSKSSLA